MKQHPTNLNRQANNNRAYCKIAIITNKTNNTLNISPSKHTIINVINNSTNK